jgi:glyoxylate reductase
MSGSKPPLRTKILLLGEIDFAKDKWSDLASTHEIITPTSTTRSDFIAECKSPAFKDITGIYRTFPSITTTGRFDTALIAALPPSIKFISHCGAGYDHIDPSACSDRGILVANVTDPVNDATADTAMWLLLGCLREFGASMASLRRGEWRDGGWGKSTGARGPPPMGHDPRGKVLGIVGMGGIGRNMKRKAEAFGMKVVYYNRRRLDAGLEDGAEYIDSLKGLLKVADVVSLNLPLNANTRHTISTAQFGMMKKSAILINTARGAVVDEDALVRALDEGVIAGAGLDVYEDEPVVREGLLRNEQVLLLPHVGTYTWETMYRMEAWAIENVRVGVEEGRLVSPIPEHKDLSFRP